jgi:Na+/proline symporter
MGLLKIIKILALVLSLVGVILYIMIFLKGDQAIKDTLFNGEDVVALDWALYVTYIIFALVLAFVLFFALKGLVSGNVKKTLLPIIVLLVIVVISYVLADGTEMQLKEGILSESGSKWVGTGLYSFYILAIIAIGTMIFSGFKKAK